MFLISPESREVTTEIRPEPLVSLRCSVSRLFGGDVFLGLLQHIVMRCGFVFVVLRLHVILAHGKILEAIPHQDAAQIRVAFKHNAEQVKDFSLLKFATAPDRCERGGESSDPCDSPCGV